MIKRLEYIQDLVGQNYIGINIYQDEVMPFLNQLKEILDTDFEEYTTYQKERDHGHYHITVINVMEYNRLSKNSNFINQVEDLFKKEMNDINLMGIGTATKNNNRAFFIVAKSEQLAEIRNMYGLPMQDFHITLGFKWKDVFGVRKNQIMEKFNVFLKLLVKEYYKNENFNFVKDIENYDIEHDEEIIPIQITENHVKIFSGGYFMDIGWLDDSKKFWIMTKYKSDENPIRLSQNEISKILK